MPIPAYCAPWPVNMRTNPVSLFTRLGLDMDDFISAEEVSMTANDLQGMVLRRHESVYARAPSLLLAPTTFFS